MRFIVLGLVTFGCACGPNSLVDDAGSIADAGGVGGGSASVGGGSASVGGGSEAVGGGAATVVDLDRDGLDDAYEARIAADYLPVMAMHPSDACPLGGLLYRVRPHPLDASLLHVLYVHLLERDCGLTSHVGDDEVFAITVNPTLPAPTGITAMKAISHQDTICQRISECGSCNSLSACATPRTVYFSKDKHGAYLSLSACSLSCLDQCSAGQRPDIPLANAGEPSAHLTEDLTDAGFITAANGWSQMSVFHFNPWQPMTPFGTAGVVADDLIDAAFDTAACR